MKILCILFAAVALFPKSQSVVFIDFHYFHLQSGQKVKPYTFTITNTCTTSNAKDPIHYKVTLNTLTSPISNLTPSLRYKLNETSPTSKENPSAMLTTASTYDLGSIKSEYNIDTTYNLIDGTLAPGESVTYNLYLWIDENAGNDIMGNTFTGKVLIYNYM